MDILVREYIREDGSSPYTDWFNGLDPYAAAKVTTATVRLGLGILRTLRGSLVVLANMLSTGVQVIEFTWPAKVKI